MSLRQVCKKMNKFHLDGIKQYEFCQYVWDNVTKKIIFRLVALELNEMNVESSVEIFVFGKMIRKTLLFQTQISTDKVLQSCTPILSFRLTQEQRVENYFFLVTSN